MTDLSRFPITARWPATNPDVIQLYSFPTPNGVKATLMLEETGLPYEPHRVTLAEADVKSPAFVSLNPNGRIPALIDPNGPDGTPVEVFESGAILLYLAEKTGMLLPSDAQARAATLSWLMFQIGGVGPMFGQLGYFAKFAGKDIEDPRPRTRYVDEAKRLLGVMDRHLAGNKWMIGDDYTIADIALFPWVRQLGNTGYDVAGLVGLDQFANVQRWRDAAIARPASQRGLFIPARAA